MTNIFMYNIVVYNIIIVIYLVTRVIRRSVNNKHEISNDDNIKISSITCFKILYHSSLKKDSPSLKDIQWRLIFSISYNIKYFYVYVVIFL